MLLYIPFIHKKVKEKKETQLQLPVYIEQPIPIEKSIEKENENIVIIELF